MVRTRFAPSPTGYLHIGGVRTALFNWLFARKHGGQFILRIDDTDQQRNVAEALQPILDGFRWLGLDWDEGPTLDGTNSTGPHAPYFQSQRGDRYSKAAKILLESGHAYRDYATTEEVAAEREAAEKEKRPFVYSRRWMAEDEEQAAAFEAEGRQAVVRLKMPREGKCRLNDLVRGDVEFEWAAEQDHVIQRADGTCLYHLANVVDDHDFEVTHVIRAVEHLSNTPRQTFIAEALGYELPTYAHLPYVAEPSGTKKLSKRKIKDYLKNREFQKLYDHGHRIAESIGIHAAADTFNPVLVDFYREVGYLPDAVVNYLLLLGWSLDDKTERFSRDEMIKHFSLERVNKSPASFDPQKLFAFQAREMLAYPMKKKVAMVLPYLQKAGLVPSPPECDIGGKLTAILKAAGDRVKVAGDILDYTEFFVADDGLEYVEKDFQKRLRKPPEAGELLTKFKNVLETAEPFKASQLEKLLKDFVESEDIKIGQIIHALRVSVTGKAVGFGMFDTLEILGRESCLARIDRALAALETKTATAHPETAFPSRLFTVEEYHRMGEAGVLAEDDRVELLEGRIVTKMNHNPQHDGTVQLVDEAISDHLPRGYKVRIQSSVTTSDSEPEPDVAVVRGAIQEFLSRHPGPSDLALVVEVSETSLRRDRAKRRLYSRASIPVYWIVNLVDSQLEVYTEPTGEVASPHYQQTDILTPDQQVSLVIDGKTVGTILVRELLP